jgi:5-hydroxyisourate hydrolase
MSPSVTRLVGCALTPLVGAISPGCPGWQRRGLREGAPRQRLKSGPVRDRARTCSRAKVRAARGPLRKVSKLNVSVRVIDGIYGRPAVGVSVELSREVNGAFVTQWREKTDDDGRISSLRTSPLTAGGYRLEFDLDGYFRALGYASLNSAIGVRFFLASQNQHYALSVLITPTSCTTFKDD